MCRFYAFRANVPTSLQCTLLHAENALRSQSRKDSRGETHADGWGLGCYTQDDQEIIRRATAAYVDVDFDTAASHLSAHTLIAHVRQASVGSVAIENTHPFSHGRWLFAHNGTVYGFDQIAPLLEEETDPALRECHRGNTDSEHVFYWLLTQMDLAGVVRDGVCSDLPGLRRVLCESMHQLAEWSAEAAPLETTRLNFMLTDGVVVLASRWRHSLYWLERDGVQRCAVCGSTHVVPELAAGYRAVEIASEPMSHEGWLEVPDMSVLSVDADIRPRIIAC